MTPNRLVPSVFSIGEGRCGITFLYKRILLVCRCCRYQLRWRWSQRATIYTRDPPAPKPTVRLPLLRPPARPPIRPPTPCALPTRPFILLPPVAIISSLPRSPRQSSSCRCTAWLFRKTWRSEGAPTCVRTTGRTCTPFSPTCPWTTADASPTPACSGAYANNALHVASCRERTRQTYYVDHLLLVW